MLKYDKYAVGDVLRELRNQQNLTQLQVAEKMGLSAIHYSLIEQGQRKFSIEVLFKIMDVFNVDADRVLGLKCKDVKTDVFAQKLSKLTNEEQEYVTKAWILLVDGLVLHKERMAG